MHSSPHVATIQGVDLSACCGKAESRQSDRRSTEAQQTEQPTDHQLEQQTEQQASCKSDPKARRSPESVTILIAEDNELLRGLLVQMLAKLKLTVVVVEDGALAITEVHDSKVDLILMYGQMPNKDGYQATREIKSDPDPPIASTDHCAYRQRIQGRSRALPGGWHVALLEQGGAGSESGVGTSDLAPAGQPGRHQRVEETSMIINSDG
jgi:CheY-like chemotaxis protein